MLAGRFDGRTPRYSLLLHWRYYGDPPEFFTVLAGNTDGLHWGYFLDDPGRAGGCVASYFARDAYEFSVDGNDLFDAVRLHLEHCHRDCEDYLEDDPDSAAEHLARLDRLARLRERLMACGTGNRRHRGEAYTERYQGRCRRRARITARTVEGMGIVVPAKRFRPLSLEDRTLWRELRRVKNPTAMIEEAWQAVRDGFPGTALKLGKDLWPWVGEVKTTHACDLLDAAYEALGRETLRDVLRTHLANRSLPSVDILDAEEE